MQTTTDAPGRGSRSRRSPSVECMGRKIARRPDSVKPSRELALPPPGRTIPCGVATALVHGRSG